MKAAKVFDQGCLAYYLDSSEIHSEYAPYTYADDLKEFINGVTQLNRTA